jgi:hypothetical protein
VTALKERRRPADSKNMSSTPTPNRPATYSVRRARCGGLEVRWAGTTVMAAGAFTVDGPGAELDAGRRLLEAHGYSEVNG